jgi:cell division inhibitor SepF
MSALYRLKAYFGMVPAEDMDAYLDYDDETGYYGEQRAGYAEPRQEHRQDHRPERAGMTAERLYAERHYAERKPVERAPLPEPAPIGVPSARNGSAGAGRAPVTRGALAVEPLAAEPPRQAEPVHDTVRASASASAKDAPLSRITTIHPRSYNEARTIGERYREGIPVIMNLTELDDAAAKRLVDFAAGLAFALRGSIDKVTNRVFLLSPMGVDVSAEERRKLAERGFFGQD